RSAAKGNWPATTGRTQAVRRSRRSWPHRAAPAAIFQGTRQPSLRAPPRSPPLGLHADLVERQLAVAIAIKVGKPERAERNRRFGPRHQAVPILVETLDKLPSKPRCPLAPPRIDRGILFPHFRLTAEWYGHVKVRDGHLLPRLVAPGDAFRRIGVHWVVGRIVERELQVKRLDVFQR